MAPIYTFFHGQEDNRPTQSPSGSHGGRDGLRGTRCGAAVNKHCEKGGRFDALHFFLKAVKLEL